MCDIDSDPASTQSFRHLDRRAASTEGIENHVTLIGRRLDNPLEESFWLLGWVSEPLCGLRIDGEDVRPYISHENAVHVL